MDVGRNGYSVQTWTWRLPDPTTRCDLGHALLGGVALRSGPLLKTLLFLIQAFLSVTVLTAAGQAQTSYLPRASVIENGTAPALADLTISKRVDEVNLAFTVTDKRGRFISNLAPADFQILDDHRPPQEVKYFQQQSDLPLRVALLIDASSSIKYRFKFEQRAASVFLKNILRPMKDLAFVVAFDARVHLVHDLTGDVSALSKAVKAIKPGGNTVLYDAVIFACSKLRNIPETQATRRAVILISDGNDTASRDLMYDAQRATARSEVVMFALSTNDLSTDPYPKGEAVLDLLTLPTGGRILAARDEYQLSSAFHKVEKALRNQYALAYLPADFSPDGSYRAIEIIPQKNGLKVQCRKGYFARQEQAKK
jgi:Ca-activated chloride channel family protein